MSTVDNETVCLDHSSTTAIAPEALEALLPYLQTADGSPSSSPQRPAPSGTSKRTARCALRRSARAALCRRFRARQPCPYQPDLVEHTLFVSFRGVAGADLLGRAPGITASIGWTCHTAGEVPSATLAAMEAAPEVAHSAMRLSLGRDTTGVSVPLTVAALVAAWRRARDEHDLPQTSKRRGDK
ncbi:MAG: hypothetical protein ACP5PM_09750 [Acidimicrobiales bacterium]